MSQHILLATDGTESSDKAENHALQLSGSCGIKLTIFHILDDKLCHYGEVDTLVPLEARETFISYVIEEQEEASQEIVNKIKQKAEAFNDADYEFKLAKGEPVEVIAEIANTDSSIDLIVVGGLRSKQKRGFRGLSFADRLCSKTSQSIITVV